MITINNLLEIGKTGLLASQARMAVTAHNVANVNTPGYHRQRVLLQTQPPISPFGSAYKYYFGTGVKIADIIRDYNQMTEATLRDQVASSSKHGQLAQALQDAEVMLAGSDDANLNARLQEFWTAWQDLANNADSPAYRNIMLQRSQALTSQFNNLADRLTQYRREILSGTEPDATGAIARDIGQINSLAERIADLNKRIDIISLYGSNPNDLKDSRDILVGQLSELTDVEVIRDGNSYTINLDGQLLVSGSDHYQVTVADDGFTPGPGIVLEIEDPVGGPNIAITPTEGRVGGWLEAAREYENLLAQLDVMAAEMITAINDLHVTGFNLAADDGLLFFEGTSAATITLHADVLGQPENIAAAATRTANPTPPPNWLPNVGDGAIALEIAELCTQRLAALGNRAFGAYFTDMLSTLGVRVQTESALANDAHNVITALQASLAAESGVNLDEEMVEMLAAQRAFSASSKIITSADEMLDVLINRMMR